MRITTTTAKINTIKKGLIAFGVLESKDLKTGKVFGELNKMSEGALFDLAKEDSFTGKAKSKFVWRSRGVKGVTQSVVCFGLGKEKDITLESVREFAGLCLKEAEMLKQDNVTIALGSFVDLSDLAVGQALAEGIELAAYTYSRYKKSERHVVKSVVLVVETSADKDIKNGLKIGQFNAGGVNLARELVDTPGGHMHPSELVAAAKRIAATSPRISIKVHNKTELKKLGAGGLLGVSQGSKHDPALVHLIYKPQKKAKKKIAVVGKAVTFDSGGLSLKPADAMMNMKIDMAGSAAVIGVFARLAKIGVDYEVHGIFGACENSVSADAIRPGDVITVMNGKTIEVLNTDAEGRLTLADTLTFATRQKPDMIIDMATLTGACLVALGEEISGVMANKKEVAESILTAAKEAGENMWELPLEARYVNQIKSDIADYKNIGGRYGGTLTAGLFLEPFVNKIPWAHIDIAGPCYAEKPLSSYLAKGATGHGVRTILQLLSK